MQDLSCIIAHQQFLVWARYRRYAIDIRFAAADWAGGRPGVAREYGPGSRLGLYKHVES
jgi:hypothetical protein